MSDPGKTLSQATSAELVRLSRDGDQAAANVLYDRYVERLTRLANRHLNNKYNARINSEDVVQSIFRTVWRVTKEKHPDRMEFSDDTGFWKWLVTVGLNKIYRKIDEASAAKRSVDREFSGDASEYTRQVAERSPLPSHVAEVADLYETILGGIDPMEQEILQYRLVGFSQIEIAEKIGVNVRTIRRRMFNIRQKASEILDANMPPALD